MSLQPENAVLDIVCIEEEDAEFEAIRQILTRSRMGAQLYRVTDEAGLHERLARWPALVLCSNRGPGVTAMRALQLAAGSPARPPVVVIARDIPEDALLRLFRAGVSDFVARDKLSTLPAIAARVLQQHARERERERSDRQLAHAYARHRQLCARLFDAQERERAALSRELHDELAHLLSGVVIHLHALSRTEDALRARRACAQALALTEQALARVRRLSLELREPALDGGGFVPALQAMVERMLTPAGVNVQVTAHGTDPWPQRPSRVAALRIVQQAFFNVLRHARARHAKVRVRFSCDGRLIVTVSDDGCGLDITPTLRKDVDDRSLGLHGMRERAELADGRFAVRSRRGVGTMLRLRFD